MLETHYEEKLHVILRMPVEEESINSWEKWEAWLNGINVEHFKEKNTNAKELIEMLEDEIKKMEVDNQSEFKVDPNFKGNDTRTYDLSQ